MSLLNRMLGELAARQAPGSEALAGVQLTEPLAAAQSALSLRRVALATALAAGAAASLWSLWPRTDNLPPPAVRESSSSLAAPSPQAAQPVVAPAAVSAPQPEAEMRLPSLRMDSRLMLAQHPPEAAVREFSAASAAPRAAPTASNARARDRAKDRAERSTPLAAPPDAEAVGVTPTAPPQAAAAAGAAAASASRKQSAREALARGEPAEALARLGADDGDTESSALRAAALQRLGRHEAAAASYRRLTESDPAEAAHWVGLGISLEGLQRTGEAGFSYRRALAMPTLAPTLRRFAQERLGAMGTP